MASPVNDGRKWTARDVLDLVMAGLGPFLYLGAIWLLLVALNRIGHPDPAPWTSLNWLGALSVVVAFVLYCLAFVQLSIMEWPGWVRLVIFLVCLPTSLYILWDDITATETVSLLVVAAFGSMFYVFAAKHHKPVAESEQEATDG